MANSTVDLCVTKQKLDRAEVAVLFQALRFGVVARSSTSWHDLPSDPPSWPIHQHRAGSGIVSSVARTAFRSPLVGSVLQRHSAAQSPNCQSPALQQRAAIAELAKLAIPAFVQFLPRLFVPFLVARVESQDLQGRRPIELHQRVKIKSSFVRAKVHQFVQL